MSFLLTFIRLVLITLFLGAVVFLGGRELVLFFASEQVASDARQLMKTNRWDQYISDCTSSVEFRAFPYEGVQLRFTDHASYSLEVDCTSKEPVVWETDVLPQMVKKTRGSAGFFYDSQNNSLWGEIQLELLGQKRVVYVDGEEVHHTWGTTTYVAGKPASSCQAFGYVCCEPENQQGVGEKLSGGVIDCSQNCFSSCLPRPVLLSFQSDPAIDYEARTVRVPATESLLIFYFTFDESGAPIDTVTLNYGDGTEETFETASGLASKEYSCPTGRCAFTVSIQATDTKGVTSPTTRLSGFTVEVDNSL